MGEGLFSAMYGINYGFKEHGNYANEFRGSGTIDYRGNLVTELSVAQAKRYKIGGETMMYKAITVTPHSAKKILENLGYSKTEIKGIAPVMLAEKVFQELYAGKDNQPGRVENLARQYIDALR
jgi:hypothetical protein